MGQPPQDNYRDASGTILMCMHCRRTRRGSPGECEWELVEAYVQQPPKGVSHGLCPDCLDKHYPPVPYPGRPPSSSS